MFKVNNKDTTTTPYNIKRFVKIFNGFKLLITLAKHSILHIWQGSEYTSELIFTLRKKYPYLEFFWSVFSRDTLISPYSVRMRENGDQKNSEYGHFSRIVNFYGYSRQSCWFQKFMI